MSLLVRCLRSASFTISMLAHSLLFYTWFENSHQIGYFLTSIHWVGFACGAAAVIGFIAPAG